MGCLDYQLNNTVIASNGFIYTYNTNIYYKPLLFVGVIRVIFNQYRRFYPWLLRVQKAVHHWSYQIFHRDII